MFLYGPLIILIGVYVAGFRLAKTKYFWLPVTVYLLALPTASWFIQMCNTPKPDALCGLPLVVLGMPWMFLMIPFLAFNLFGESSVGLYIPIAINILVLAGMPLFLRRRRKAD